MSRRLLSIIKHETQVNELEPHKQFMHDVMCAMEDLDKKNRRKGSKWYKPSGLHCMRNMYFTRLGAEQDTAVTDYKSVGMANTGTMRHEAIQDALMAMKELGYNWEYVDVEEYINKKHSEGKCLTVTVKGKCGAETALFDSALKISFRCDGIIRNILTNAYYLFEFKNVISFKYGQVDNTILDQHHNQVVCYCTALDLDKAFVTYENRDTCELCVPIVYKVTQEMKNALVALINECESYVERLVAPPKTEDKKHCRWCPYKTICKKVR